MKITRLDIVVAVFLSVSLALMLPVPWLLSSANESILQPDLIPCTPVGLSVDALVLADLGMASRTQTGGCPTPKKLTVRSGHNNNHNLPATATRYDRTNFDDSATPTADKVLP